jgi:putative ABC transport system permease protein
VWQDMRFAWRLFGRSRGFTAVAVAMLALGMGANTAVFSILQGTLLRPLPYRDAGRLVDVLDESSREARLSKLFATYRDYREYQRHARTLEQVEGATWAVRHPILTYRGRTRQVFAMPATAGFFSLLGARPALGRGFTPEDAEGGCAVVLAHAFWVSNFGGDAGAVGQSIALDGRPCRVVGVMAADFAFYPGAAEMWRAITPELMPQMDTMPLFIVARLRAGFTAEQAQAELRALHQALNGDGRERQLRPAVDALHSEFTWLAGRNLRTTLWLLLGAVGLVLLIACGNVAGLQLGRSMGRARELAVRAALGGGRGRLARQLLTEALLLAAAGGALGVAVAVGALQYFRAVNPVELPVGAEIGLSVPALWFTGAATVLTAVLFGLAPAWKLSRADWSGALKSGGRGGIAGGGRSRVARALIAAEVALSVALLAGAGLLMRSVLRMGSESLGFDAQGLYAARIVLPVGAYPEAAERWRFYERLERAVAARPGVRAVAAGDATPPFYAGNYAVEIDGRANAPDRAVHDVAQSWIGASWLRTMGIALRRGREFDAHDGAGAPAVAIVDEAMAREYFRGADPIGRRIRIASDERENPWATIVGLAAAVKRTSVFQEVGWGESATIYRPLAQATQDAAVALMVRMNAGAPPVGPELERAASEVDSGAAVGTGEATEKSMARVLAYPRFRAVVFGAFAAFALLLAAVGLYGVLNQLVALRRQEIGVRMALGARQADIMRMVALEGGAPVAAGLLLGLGAALGAGRWGAALLYGVHARDPLTLAAVTMALGAATALAIAIPARRASRVDPLDALRAD